METNKNLGDKIILENKNESDSCDNIIADKNESPREDNIFKKLNIYVEIYNNGIDQSDLLDEALISNGANVSKRLNKGLNVIIYKEGKDRTVDFALNNKIKLINPLWVHESITNFELQQFDKYLVTKNFTDLYINGNNKKRNYNQISNNSKTNKSHDEIYEAGKKKKTEHVRNKVNLPGLTGVSGATGVNIIKIIPTVKKSDALNTSTSSTNSKTKSLDNIHLKNDIKLNNKITNFFKPKNLIVTDQKTKSDSLNSEEKNNFTPTTTLTPITKQEVVAVVVPNSLIKISSISVGEEGKFKINNCVKSLGFYTYIGESLESITQSEYIVVNEVHSKNDVRYIYSLLNKKKMISIKYFIDSKNENIYKTNIEEYLKEYPFDFNSIEEKKMKEDFPFKENQFKIYLHPSLYEKEPMKKDVLEKVIEIIGVRGESNIRLSDICIVNKEDINEHFPGHVKLLNEIFLFDCFFNSKVMELDKMKYFPEKIKLKNKV